MQWWLLKRQSAILKEQKDIMDRQQKAMDAQNAIMETQSTIMTEQKDIAKTQTAFSKEQIDISDQQRAIMDRQTTILDGTLVETQKNATATQQAAEVARDALHLTEAADVHFARLITPDGKLNPNSVLTIVFKNYGRTRAVNGKYVWRYWIHDPNNYPIGSLKAGDHITPAQGEEHIPAEETIAGNFQQFTETILNGPAAFGFTAALRFDDIFESTVERRYVGSFNRKDGSWTQTLISEEKTQKANSDK
jgi:hypothetical protein